MLLQADFYFEDPEDQKRPDEIREGDGLDDMVQDARQLSPSSAGCHGGVDGSSERLRTARPSASWEPPART